MFAAARARDRVLARCPDGAFDITYAARRPPLRLPRSASRPSDDALAAGARRRSAGATWSSTPTRGTRALRAPRACASTSAASPRATRSTTRSRSCAPRHRHADRQARRRQPRHRRPRAAGPGRSACAIRAAPSEVVARAAARGRRDLDLRRLRALLRSRRRALPPPHRSGDRQVAARDIHSVTILADDGLTSEALSKSVFVLGVERGMRARRVAAAASTPSSSTLQGALHYSSGLLAAPTARQCQHNDACADAETIARRQP